MSLPRLDALIGNDRARTLLQQALAAGTLPQSVLLHGPQGVGKSSAALAVAAALICPEARAGAACGSCSACGRMAVWSHPDVRLLESEPASTAAGRPVHFAADTPRATRLQVGQVRRLLRDLALTPFEAQRRVFLVHDLEQDPSQACANALLKALEEPPGHTRFLLVSSRPERLPPTVRSRCQMLAFMPASRPDVASFLEARGVEPAEASLRAALSGGRPGHALTMDAGAGLAVRDAALEALAAALAGPVEALAAGEALLAAAGDLAALLDTLALLARDALVLLAGGGVLFNVDRTDELADLADRMGAAGAARLLERAAWCVRASERQVAPPLMLATLLLEAGGHVPLPPLDAPLTAPEHAT